MKCLNEGTLQAYLDRELPEVEMRGICAHVEGCVNCRGRLTALEATAQRVHAWLDWLPPAECAVPARFAAPIRPRRVRWQWAAVAAAVMIAASAAVLHRPKTAVPAKIAAKPAVAQSPIVQEPEPRPAVPHRAVRVRKRMPPSHRDLQPAGNEFIALGDADPMQIGVVVRVNVPIADTWLPGATRNVAADLLIGEDGRARAIRFVPSSFNF